MSREADFPRESPFAGNPAHPRVWVTQGEDPYATACRALAEVDLSPARGKRVLLKPNAGRMAGPGQGVNTSAQVVAAAIDAFRSVGADPSVGESPITGVQALDALEACGIASICRERECPCLDLDEGSFVEMALPEGQAIHVVRVCAAIPDFDMVVSIPVMKTHMHTGVTLAVKNMKGCLWRRSKVDLHMLPRRPDSDEKPLNVAIADLASVLRPHLALIDGSIGMEGLGPGAGEPKPLGAMVVSTDAFAADAVACHLMGFEASGVPHLRMGADRGYGVIDLDAMEVAPDGWRGFARPFLKAPDSLSFHFANVSILDSQSCSACQSTLLLFLRRYGDKLFEVFPSDPPVRIAIGRGHSEVPEGTLCIGNCTSRHRDKGLFVPGCPPVGSEILDILSEAGIRRNEKGG